MTFGKSLTFVLWYSLIHHIHTFYPHSRRGDDTNSLTHWVSCWDVSDTVQISSVALRPSKHLLASLSRECLRVLGHFSTHSSWCFVSQQPVSLGLQQWVAHNHPLLRLMERAHFACRYRDSCLSLRVFTVGPFGVKIADDWQLWGEGEIITLAISTPNGPTVRWALLQYYLCNLAWWCTLAWFSSLLPLPPLITGKSS